MLVSLDWYVTSNEKFNFDCNWFRLNSSFRETKICKNISTTTSMERIAQHETQLYVNM